MPSKKHKVLFTTDGRKTADITIGKKGFITANRDLVVLVDDEEMENPCYGTEHIMSRLKRGGNNEIVK